MFDLEVLPCLQGLLRGHNSAVAVPDFLLRFLRLPRDLSHVNYKYGLYQFLHSFYINKL